MKLTKTAILSLILLLSIPSYSLAADPASAASASAADETIEMVTFPSESELQKLVEGFPEHVTKSFIEWDGATIRASKVIEVICDLRASYDRACDAEGFIKGLNIQMRLYRELLKDAPNALAQLRADGVDVNHKFE